MSRFGLRPTKHQAIDTALLAILPLAPKPPCNRSNSMAGGWSYITVKAEAGRPDSLNRRVKIAFITSPHEPNGPSHPYRLIAKNVKDFDVGTESTTIACCPIPEGDTGSKFQLAPRTTSSKVLTSGSGSSYVAPLVAGQVASWSATSTWNKPAQKNHEIAPQQASFLISNKSASKQEVVVGPEGCGWHIVYHPLETGRSITVPCHWALQAYVVDDSVTELTILEPENLKHPIFPKPIPLDPLPAGSTWILSQDNDGTIRINNDEYNPVKAVADPATKKDPLSEVLERLTGIEKAIVKMQDDYTFGQKAMIDMRTQLLALERVAATKEEVKESRAELNRNIAAVEARAEVLAGSFDQNQDRLSAVRKTVADTQTLLAGVEKSTQDQLHDLKRQLPLVESKAETAVTSASRSHDRISTLEDSAGRTQQHVVAIERAVHQTQDHLSIVQRLITGNTQPGTVKLNLEGAIPEPSSLSQGPLGDRDNRIPEIEGRVEKLERSTGEQRKAFRAMDHRVRAELGAVKALVTGLDNRVDAIETRSEDDGARGRSLSSSASVEGSPVTFPNHLSDGPPSA